MGSSSVMTISEALSGVTRLGFDTAPIIYFVEEHDTYDRRVTAVFERIVDSSLLGFTSVISLCEVLVQPMRTGDSKLQHSYRELLLYSKNFEVLPVDSNLA